MDTIEVARLLREFDGEPDATYREEYGWHGWREFVPWRDSQVWGDPVEVPGLGKVEMANTYTGGEGGGSEAEMVFRITDTVGSVKYYRLFGYYSSYDGTEWDGDLTEVRPRQKTITVFE